ncbi:uncharacterized protein LOC134662943 [Cydia amplana]|uniref:uncharacterized protein LOC134647672 n=1 Tax=Cydia amplana TaxID=1869771 RepID=UPI002FE621C1
MANYLAIAAAQKSLEASVNRMFTEFEAKLNKSPAVKVTVASLSEEFVTFREQTLSMLKLLRDQIQVLSDTQDAWEMNHRRKYLLFNRVPEDPAEAVGSRIAGIISEQLKIPGIDPASFKACHRLGKSSVDHIRPILVRFNDMHVKTAVWRKKTSCKGSGYTISEFLTPRRQALFIQARKAFGMRSCWSQDGIIFVKLASGRRERVGSEEDIERLKQPISSVQPPLLTSTPEPGAAAAVDAGPGTLGGETIKSKRR